MTSSNPASVAGDATPAGPATPRVNVARDVTMIPFYGRRGEDGRRWLSLYERFAACYGWDHSFKLAYVAFYLKDMAATWFDNNEPQFGNWENFVALFKKVYADDGKIAQNADEQLRTRAQRPGETCQDYVQEILKLCREKDAAMPEPDKVAHVLKGIAENVYYLLLLKSFKKIDEILDFAEIWIGSYVSAFHIKQLYLGWITLSRIQLTRTPRIFNALAPSPNRSAPPLVSPKTKSLTLWKKL